MSFKFEKEKCLRGCNNNADLKDLTDFNEYECYSCGIPKKYLFEEGTNLYLQNSGSLDIVWADLKVSQWNKLCEVKNYPHVYQWFRFDENKQPCIFALHDKNGALSDECVFNKLDELKDSFHI